MFRDLVHAVALSSARFALQRKSPIGPRHGHLTDLSSAQARRSPYQPCFPNDRGAEAAARGCIAAEAATRGDDVALPLQA
jgi:hypothetical protein